MWCHFESTLFEGWNIKMSVARATGQILHSTKIATFDSSTQHSKPLSLVTKMSFVKHLHCSYKGYCNALPVTGADRTNQSAIMYDCNWGLVCIPMILLLMTRVLQTRRTCYMIQIARVNMMLALRLLYIGVLVTLIVGFPCLFVFYPVPDRIYWAQFIFVSLDSTILTHIIHSPLVLVDFSLYYSLSIANLKKYLRDLPVHTFSHQVHIILLVEAHIKYYSISFHLFPEQCVQPKGYDFESFWYQSLRVWGQDPENLTHHHHHHPNLEWLPH